MHYRFPLPLLPLVALALAAVAPAARARGFVCFDLNRGGEGSDPAILAVNGDRLLVGANNGFDGEEPWVWRDGAPRMVLNAWPGASPPVGSAPADGAALGAGFCFRADDGVHGAELWRTDDATGTILIANLRPDTGAPAGSYPSMLTAAAGGVFFVAEATTAGRRLWHTDGTGASTRLLSSVADEPSFLLTLGPGICFRASTPAAGEELWISDGTPGGTRLAGEVVPGPADGRLRMLTAAAGQLFFSADDGTRGAELWRYDGTKVELVRDIRAGGSSEPGPMIAIGSRIFFTADDGMHGRELWTSDGTAAGTDMVLDIWPGFDESRPGEFVLLGSEFMFSADDGVHGTELWISDGTAGGTRLLRDIAEGSTGGIANESFPAGFEPCAGLVYFTADDHRHGRELWSTDGTPQGTAIVGDICIGTAGSLPTDLTALGDLLFFSADDGQRGKELWFYNPRNGVEDWPIYR